MLIIVKHLEVASKIYEKCDVIPNTYKKVGKKKPKREIGLFEKIRAWRFPTFAWQSATLSLALSGFTSEFGMGSGGSRSLCSPSKLVLQKG